MFTKIIRIILGLVLVFFGANKLFNFLPMEMPSGIPGYIFSAVGFLEVFIGLMLLLKRWVAFALVLLAPISINILLFHLFLAFSGLPVALAILLFNAVLIYKHWPQYKPLFY